MDPLHLNILALMLVHIGDPALACMAMEHCACLLSFCVDASLPGHVLTDHCTGEQLVLLRWRQSGLLPDGSAGENLEKSILGPIFSLLLMKSQLSQEEH
jgi:hypothetical protein